MGVVAGLSSSFGEDVVAVVVEAGRRFRITQLVRLISIDETHLHYDDDDIAAKAPLAMGERLLAAVSTAGGVVL